METLRAVGLSNSDLRWLLHEGLVAHAEAVGSTRGGKRQFRLIAKYALPSKSCFVLSEAGQALAKRLAASVMASGRASGRQPLGKAGRGVPRWHQDRRELFWDCILVKRYPRPAPNQELVLSAFEEEGWPARIDDPLPPHPNRDPVQCLHDTINHLHRGQLNPLIHFRGDGTGRGVYWEFLGTNAAP